MSDNPEALKWLREFRATNLCEPSVSDAWNAALAQQAATPTDDLTVPPPMPPDRLVCVSGKYANVLLEDEVHARDAIWSARVAAARQAATPAPAEPVAHLLRDDAGNLKLAQYSPPPSHAFPVYAAPPATPAAQPADEREAFEAWVMSASPFKNWSGPRPLEQHRDPPRYFYAHVDGAWAAWQAAARQAATPTAEQCALICEAQAERFMQGSPLEGNKPYAAIECAKAIRATLGQAATPAPATPAAQPEGR